jgi:lipoprotein signal peptidase
MAEGGVGGCGADLGDAMEPRRDSGPHLETRAVRSRASRAIENREPTNYVSPSNHPLRRAARKLLGHRRTSWREGAHPGRRATDHEPVSWTFAVEVGIGVALVDWTVKFLIARSIPLGDLREVIAGRVAFWHVRNDAMVLGLWGNFSLDTRKIIALCAGLVGAVVLAQILGRGHRFPPGQRRWAAVFVGLVMGGMLGNLGERVIHWGVTDYLSFRWGEYWLPPGNVADLALFASFPMAIPIIIFELQGRARRRKHAPTPGARVDAPAQAPGTAPGG